MAEKLQVKLRLEPEQIERLKKQAEKERRSINNMLEVMVEDYLKRAESAEDAQ